jgi:hypothetical protein
MENFKTWQEYFDKMKKGTEDAADSFKNRSSDLFEGFKSGYAAAKEKTGSVLTKEYSAGEKGLILGCVLLFGILIGVCIGVHHGKNAKKCCEDEED